MADATTSRRAFLFGALAPARAIAIGEACLARAGVYCQSCRDACEPGALGFLPRAGAVPVPVLDAAACTACGECVAACPAAAITLYPGVARHA